MLAALAAAASPEGQTFLPTKVAAEPWLVLLPALPLLAALLLGPAGPLLVRVGGAARVRQAGVVFAALTVLVVALSCAVLGMQENPGHPLVARLWTLAEVGALHDEATLLFDPLAAAFALPVALVAFVAQLYRPGLALDDTRALRQSAWAHAFAGALLVLVLADDAALLLAGWQGAALCGWGLLGRRGTPIGGTRFAMKAFVMNRLGDVGLVIGGALLFWALGASGWDARGRIEKDVSLARLHGGAAAFEIGARRAAPVPVGVEEALKQGDRQALGASWIVPGPTTSLHDLRDAVTVESTGVRRHLESLRLWGGSLLFVVCLALLAAAATRCAQAPVHVWLPDAVARALPASSLLLSALTPLGGVYLVARVAFLFSLSPEALRAVAIVGAASAAFSGMLALARRDLQKLLGQLAAAQFGLVFLALGAGAFTFAVGHALVVAAFECVTWLAAGTIVRTHDDEQDMRRLGLHAVPARMVWIAYAASCFLLALWPAIAAFGAVPDALAATLGAPQLQELRWVLFAAAWLSLLVTTAASWRSFGFAFAGRERAPLGTEQAPRGQLALGLLLLVAAPVATWAGPLLPRWLEGTFAPAWRALPHDLPESSAASACALLAAVGGWMLARALTRPGAALLRSEAWLAALFAWLDRFVLDGLLALVAGLVQFSANLVSAIDRFFLDGIWRIAVQAVLWFVPRRKPSGGVNDRDS